MLISFCICNIIEPSSNESKNQESCFSNQDTLTSLKKSLANLDKSLEVK